MGWLIFFGIIALVVWAISSGGKKRGPEVPIDQLTQRNQEWIDFIAGYGAVASSLKEKALVQRMIDDIAEQNLGVPSAHMSAGVQIKPTKPAAVYVGGTDNPLIENRTAPLAETASAARAEEVRKSNLQLDNASLLLYFGAFLFVAAAGLFVAFGGADGILKTFVVVLVTAIMYGGGIWLHNNRPKLKQAGQAFAGIGIVLAPLIGCALYAYVFNQTQGMLVWLLTSLFCLALYVHALFVFRSSLVSYLLIFTFLSLFESGVGIASAPVYYYGWGLALIGIVLQLLHRYKGSFPELQEASTMSASVFLPIAIIVSVAMVPAEGALQLGVSLLLATAFYGLEALRTKGSEQEMDAVATQVGSTFGIVALTYGVTESWFATGVSLLIVNAVQLCAMFLYRPTGGLWRNYGSVLLIISLGSIFVTIPHAGLLLAATVLALIQSTVLWLRQRREDAYGLAVASWMAALFIGGQVTFGPVSLVWQTVITFIGLLVILAVYLKQDSAMQLNPEWLRVAAGTYVAAAASVLIVAALAEPIVSVAAAVGIAITFLILNHHDKRGEWVDVAGFTLFAPILWTFNTPRVFLLATCVALLTLIVLSLRYRREALRWASTFVWLLVPVALGHAAVGGHWSAVTYTWAYMLAMVCIIFSRAVARGVVYLSSNVAMSSYARSASLSYVVGYVTAAGVAIGASLFAVNSQLHTTLVLGLLGLTTIVLSQYVEKRDDIVAFLPVIGQAFLLSAIRPGESSRALYIFLGLSTLLAVVLYAAFADLRRQANGERSRLKDALLVSVATAFVSPAAVLFAGDADNWLMAIGLLVAGSLLLFHIRAGNQANKELAGGVLVVAVWWLLYCAHIHELQIYTHVVVATLGLYAYLRYKRGERIQSDQYLWWTLGAATIPLALQALSASGNPVYGWWLLLEQIAIMLLGMSIQRKFVTRWGLYTALAAVLYQLRGLGYAALAVLAIFLIGLAIYKLQKYNDPKE